MFCDWNRASAGTRCERAGLSDAARKAAAVRRDAMVLWWWSAATPVLRLERRGCFRCSHWLRLHDGNTLCSGPHPTYHTAAMVSSIIPPKVRNTFHLDLRMRNADQTCAGCLTQRASLPDLNLLRPAPRHSPSPRIASKLAKFLSNTLPRTLKRYGKLIYGYTGHRRRCRCRAHAKCRRFLREAPTRRCPRAQGTGVCPVVSVQVHGLEGLSNAYVITGLEERYTERQEKRGRG